MRSPILFVPPLYVLATIFLCFAPTSGWCDPPPPKKLPSYNYGLGGTPNQIQPRAIGVDRSPMSAEVQKGEANAKSFSVKVDTVVFEWSQLRLLLENGVDGHGRVNPVVVKGLGIFRTDAAQLDDDPSLEQNKLKSKVLSLSLEARNDAGHSALAPEATYGDGISGIDVGLAFYTSHDSGYAAAVKYDFTPGRYLYSAALSSALHYRYNPLIAHDLVNSIQLAQVDNKPTKFLKYQIEADVIGLTGEQRQQIKNDFELRNSLLLYDRDLQQAVFVGAHRIDGVGWVTVQGFAASKLVLLDGERGGSGVTLSVLAQAVQFDDTEGTHAGHSDGQFGASITWQNRTDYYTDSKRTDPAINPWNLRMGLEYNGRNSLEPHESFAVFARIRELKSPYHVEISPYYGVDAARRQYRGVTIGCTFPF